MEGYLCQQRHFSAERCHSKVRWTNCFHLTKDPKSLTSMQGTTSWKEGRSVWKGLWPRPIRVTTGASKLQSPSRRRGLRAREVLRSSPGLRGFPLPARWPEPLPDRFSGIRAPAKGEGAQEFHHMSSATAGNREGSATLARQEAENQSGNPPAACVFTACGVGARIPCRHFYVAWRRKQEGKTGLDTKGSSIYRIELCKSVNGGSRSRDSSCTWDKGVLASFSISARTGSPPEYLAVWPARFSGRAFFFFFPFKSLMCFALDFRTKNILHKIHSTFCTLF